MTSSILLEAAAGRAIIQPWTVELYHAAIEYGFLAEDPAYELLDGFIVRKDRAHSGEDSMTIGDRHALVVQRLVRLSGALDSHNCDLRIQQPVALPPWNEPEPDASVALGSEDDYSHRKPSADDVSCVVEVADSSLGRDLGAKLRIYASCGIAQYVVVDLVNDIVLDHRQPQAGQYTAVATLRGDETLRIAAGQGWVDLPVRRLLP